jgi:hypothetical protein
LLELHQSRSRRDNTAADPQSQSQTEAPAVGNGYELLNLIQKALSTSAVTV